MSVDDEAARKARARQLREAVAKIESARDVLDNPAPAQEFSSISPREFIQKRMHDLDRGTQDDGMREKKEPLPGEK